MRSLADPVFDPDATSIRAVIPTPIGGHIAMAGFPGLQTGVDGTPYLDPAQAEETLAGLVATGAGELMVLPEEAELPEAAFEMLRTVAKRAGLKLTFAPIEDFSVPEPAFIADWPAREQRYLAALRAGKTVALCCQYGAGRSGLTAALLLMATGMPAEAAIALVRRHFPDAIENDAQETWVRAQAR